MMLPPHACVIGSPIAHSRSPLIHGYWLDQLGIEGRYDKVEVPADGLAAFVASIGHGGLRGCNVTVPHKVAVLELADVVSEAAQAIGAANTLWTENGAIHATNTDASGFMTHLVLSAPGWAADAGPAVVIGAGGAARAIVYGLVAAGVPHVHIVNRTVARAENLARVSGPRVSAHGFAEMVPLLESARLIVNTSSLGMIGAPALDLDLASLSRSAVVADIVYVPLETPLLAAARSRGCVVVDGLGMLLHQAVPGFARWFGQTPEVTDALRNLIVADLGGS